MLCLVGSKLGFEIKSVRETFLVWFQLHLIVRWVILVLSRETKIFRDWLYVAWLKENVYNCLTCDVPGNMY